MIMNLDKSEEDSDHDSNGRESPSTGEAGVENCQVFPDFNYINLTSKYKLLCEDCLDILSRGGMMLTNCLINITLNHNFATKIVLCKRDFI